MQTTAYRSHVALLVSRSWSGKDDRARMKVPMECHWGREGNWSREQQKRGLTPSEVC